MAGQPSGSAPLESARARSTVEPDPSRRRPWGVLAAGALLIAVVALSAMLLTRLPAPYSDEGYIGSEAWSWATGHGLRPPMALGVGVFDGQIDHWAPRLGTAPFALAQLIGGVSFATYRLAAFLLALVATAITGLAVARRTRPALGALAAAALTVSWGFFSASHYIRWDSLACVISAAVMLMLWRRSPGPRMALAVGFLLGATLDVQVSLLAAAPGAALLIGWEGDGRFRRLALLAAGLLLAVGMYFAVHVGTDLSAARRQYNIVYRPDFPVPLTQVISRLSLQPYLDELNRYRDMASSGLGGVAALLTLVTGALAGISMLARSKRGYPLAAVPGVLLVSSMLTLGLIQANKTSMYVWYASPYAIAAIAVVQFELGNSNPRLSRLPATGLTLLALAGASVVVFEARATPRSPVLSRALADAAGTAGSGRRTVMAEWLYWWVLPNDRFRFNSAISLNEYANHQSFEASFARLCPGTVMLDDTWLERYIPGTLFPQFEPQSAAERPLLLADLQREYTLVHRVTISGDTFQFWRRHATTCSIPVS